MGAKESCKLTTRFYPTVAHNMTITLGTVKHRVNGQTFIYTSEIKMVS